MKQKNRTALLVITRMSRIEARPGAVRLRTTKKSNRNYLFKSNAKRNYLPTITLLLARLASIGSRPAR
jgi:hypothetical protein